jgi:hypothetical protein
MQTTRITSEDGEVIILESASPGAQTTLKINLALDALHILDLKQVQFELTIVV